MTKEQKTLCKEVWYHRLEDDPSIDEGGPKHNETVGEFVTDMTGIIGPLSTVERLNNILVSCGIKPIVLKGGE